MKEDYAEEKTLYIIGLISISCILIFFLIMYVLDINILDISIPCSILEKTGYYCPGCGGTRAVKYLLQGDILNSIRYHPVVLYIVVMGGLFMLLNTITLITKKNFSGMKVKNFWILLVPALIIGQFVFKNLLLIVWNIRII